jgi:receptor-type tyrosine-protein phosphatase N
MEDHLKNKDRLDEEWENLVAYEPDLNATTAGAEASNMRKNRYTDIIPCE